MEPRIQYAETSDGVSIAYTEAGRGAPLLVSPPPPFSRIMRPRFGIRDGYADLAEELRHIAYDPRGCGHSERNVRDFPLDRMVLDIEAVAAATGVDRFAICNQEASSPLNRVRVNQATRSATVIMHSIAVDQAGDSLHQYNALLRRIPRHVWPRATVNDAVTKVRKVLQTRSTVASQHLA